MFGLWTEHIPFIAKCRSRCAAQWLYPSNKSIGNLFSINITLWDRVMTHPTPFQSKLNYAFHSLICSNSIPVCGHLNKASEVKSMLLNKFWIAWEQNLRVSADDLVYPLAEPSKFFTHAYQSDKGVECILNAHDRTIYIHAGFSGRVGRRESWQSLVDGPRVANGVSHILASGW